MISASSIIITVNNIISILIFLSIPSKSLPMFISKGLLNRSKVSYCGNFLRFKQKSKLCNNIIKNNEKSVDNIGDNDIIHYTAISFYRFIKIKEDDIPIIINAVKSNLLEKNIKGTLLISEEGYNGQFVVPSTQLDEFRAALKLASLENFNDIDINVGQSFDVTKIKFQFPFKKLVVKRKNEVLSDGIEQLDWSDAGNELTPLEWHKQVQSMNCKESLADVNKLQDSPLLIDCRNKYESDMGHFKGAIALDTECFSNTWQTLDKLLENIPQDKQILTYCTGGIRCVKVNAYLKQKMGFKNIGRLGKGIIGYDHWIHHNSGIDQENNINSLFIGENFLFDRRRIVTEKELDIDN